MLPGQQRQAAVQRECGERQPDPSRRRPGRRRYPDSGCPYGASAVLPGVRARRGPASSRAKKSMNPSGSGPAFMATR